MPELPEVETLRRQLLSLWKGRRIDSVRCGKPSYFFLTPPSTLRKNLKGKTLVDLRRHGKTLLAHFKGGDHLLFHLGMTGQFVAKSLPQDGHVHLVLRLNDGTTLSFRDVRKFGKVQWIEKGSCIERIEHLGPDALNISSRELQRALQGRRTVIKAALLNQEILAGVGNIYADEALFAARIHPSRPAAKLTTEECTLLAQKIRAILKRAIEGGGSSINDYVQSTGETGSYQDSHQVYGKDRRPCPRCSTPIEKTTVAGRGTHFCGICQI